MTAKCDLTAFPRVVTKYELFEGYESEEVRQYVKSVGGMSLHDWFVGQIAAGIFANNDLIEALLAGTDREDPEKMATVLSNIIHHFADALIKKRYKSGAGTEQLNDFGLHLGPSECPTWYDYCHCTVATLMHNIDRAEKAEAEVRILRGEK